MIYKDGYPIQILETILEFKEKRNEPKDQKNITMTK